MMWERRGTTGIFNRKDDGYESPFDNGSNYVNPTQSNDSTASTENWTLPDDDQTSNASTSSTGNTKSANNTGSAANTSTTNSPDNLGSLDNSNVPGTFGSFNNPDIVDNLDILDKLDDARRTDRAHDHGTASPSSQPQQSTPTTASPSPQPSHPQRPQPTNHPQPTDQHHNQGRTNSPRPTRPHRLFIIVMLVIAALSLNSILRSCTDLVAGVINSKASNSYSYSTPSRTHTPTPDSSESNAPADPQINVIAHEGELEIYQGSISVNIKNAQRGINTYENKPTVIITYQWTNNQTRNSYFTSSLVPSVYQHGQGLTDTSLAAYKDADKQALSRLKYDRKSSLTETAPGKSQTVTIAYELTDLKAPILVEVGTYQSTTYIRSGFVLSGSNPESVLKRMSTKDADALANADNSKARGWQGDKTSKDSQSGEASKNATSDADAKASEADGISTGDAMFQTWDSRGGILTVESITAKKAGRDYDGNESAIITIVWRNDSQIPFSLALLGSPRFTQGNSEQSLQSAYFYPARSDYRYYAAISSVRPGVTVTSQFAVELGDTDMPVVVSMNGDSRAPKLQKEIALS